MQLLSLSFGENRLCRYQDAPGGPAPARRTPEETPAVREANRVETTYMRESFESLQDSLKTILAGYVRDQTAYLKKCDAAAKMPPETRPLLVGIDEKMQADHMYSLVRIVIRCMHAKSLEGTDDEKKKKGEDLEKALRSITDTFDTVGIQWLYTYTPGDRDPPQIASHSWIPANILENRNFVAQKSIDDRTPGIDVTALRRGIENNTLALNRHKLNAKDNFEWMGRRLLEDFKYDKKLPSETDIKEMEWALSSAKMLRLTDTSTEPWIEDYRTQQEFLKRGVIMSIRQKTSVIESAIGEIRLDTQYDRRWIKTKENEWKDMSADTVVKDEQISQWPTRVLNPRYEIRFSKLDVTDTNNEVEEQIDHYNTTIARNTARIKVLRAGRYTSGTLDEIRRLENENSDLKRDNEKLATYLKSLNLPPEKVAVHRVHTLARKLGTGYYDEKDPEIKAIMEDLQTLVKAGGKETAKAVMRLEKVMADAGYYISCSQIGDRDANPHFDVELEPLQEGMPAEVQERRKDIVAMREFAEIAVQRPDFYERDTTQPRTTPLDRPNAPAQHPYRFTEVARGSGQTPQLIVKTDRVNDVRKYDLARDALLTRFKRKGADDLIFKAVFQEKLRSVLAPHKLNLQQINNDDVYVGDLDE